MTGALFIKQRKRQLPNHHLELCGDGIGDRKTSCGHLERPIFTVETRFAILHQ
jgi:hypothetical protein